ncbi:ParB/RepB/Spo0J family partition protein [Ruegeria arenilitoris]|uniref:ParB/RepB/Spo0J family partition protein n=1 Tax=Ruegeria arenilitoris TaxID=1173585 RepID=UPI00147C1189|nr:ParB N-terminal domain-containing protein [Ruegeria arenilitoris]
MKNDTLDRVRPGQCLVRLDELDIEPDYFQFRQIPLDQYHARELREALKREGTLEPLIVWRNPENGRLVVADGHHRLAAYREAGWSDPVPVEIHDCDRTSARLLGLAENAKARLPMSGTERANAAWTLVCAKAYSKAEIVKHTGVSDGRVGKMRRVLKKLEAEGEVIPTTWWRAMKLANKGEDYSNDPEAREAMIEARCIKLDEKVGKQIATEAEFCIEAVMLMLERRLGRKVELLVEEWSKADDFDDFSLEEDLSDLPF